MIDDSPPQDQPGQASGFHEAGFDLLRTQRYDEAIAYFTPLVAVRPGDARLRMALGAAYQGAGQLSAAAVNYLKASRAAPNLAEPRVALAMALADDGRTVEGLSVLAQSANALASASSIWAAKGHLERRLERHADAEASFRKALALDCESSDILNNLAVVVRAQGRIPEAVELYERACLIAPDHAVIHANLGNAYDALGDTGRAEHHLRRALALDRASLDARHNLAAHLIRAEQQHEAIPLLESVVTEDPGRWDSLTNLGVAKLAVGDTARAEACYRSALALRPNVPETHYDLAWVLLLNGRWTDGWREYEWRWRLPAFTSRRVGNDIPEWDGAEIPEGALLVYAEQGFGDSVQFVRFALQAKARVGRVVFACPRPLIRLMQSVQGLDQVIPSDTHPLPRCDARVALMSLPLVLGVTPDTVPFSTPYVPRPAPTEAVRLPRAGDRPRIGIVWAGSPDNKIDRQRTCDVAHFRTVIEATDAEFVSLQVGARAADLLNWEHRRLIFHAEGAVGDFLDTAALIAQLDLVIGVDTAVMHLAAAMGVPAWIMLPYMPDFRWMLERNESPWYACVRLFRQKTKGEWNQVLTDISRALTHWSPPPR